MALGAAVLASSVLMTGTAAAETPDRDNSNALHSISFPTDPRFTQLLGINDHGIIAGYHGDEGTEMTPNKGFTLRIADNQNNFTDENFPGSVQTQVIGINNADDTVGFWVDNNNVQHGFIKLHDKEAENVDLPGTTNNNLLGINNKDQAAGFYTDAAGMQHGYVREKDGSFLVPALPSPSNQVTGINDKGTEVGFLQQVAGGTTSTGFILKDGKLTELRAFGSSNTMALGVNNSDDVVGTYVDANGVTKGFVYDNGKYESIEMQGAQLTVINGINNHDALVGFFMDQNGNTVGLLGQRKS